MFEVAIGFFIQLVLWISIAISPALLFMLFGFVVYIQDFGLVSMLAIPVGFMLGVLIGVYWAEAIRTRIGLLHFWGHLLRNTEITSKNDEKRHTDYKRDFRQLA